MTYELELYTSELVAKESLKSFAKECGLVLDNNKNQTDDIEFLHSDSLLPCFTLNHELTTDKPNFNDYTIPDNSIILAGSASGKLAVEILFAFLKTIATAKGGAIYDPQRGMLLYPKTTKASAPALFPVDTVSIFWKFSPICGQQQLVEIFEAIKQYLPSAYPILLARIFDSIIDACVEDSLYKHFQACSSLSWTGSRPFICGSMSSESTGTFDSSEPISTLELHFEADSYLFDEQQANLISNLFTNMATLLNCRHGATFIQRGRRHDKRGNLYTGAGDLISPGCTTIWNGIANIRAWLSWFGDVVLETIPENVLKKDLLVDGHFLKLGSLPRDQRQLSGIFPEFPAALLDPQSGDRNAAT